MKKLFICSLLALSCLAFNLSAQLPPPPTPGLGSDLGNVPPQTTFFGSVTSYFATFNTNLNTFANAKAQVWAGVDYVDGLNATSSLGIEVDLWKGVSIESVTRNAGIANTIVSQQIGVGYGVTLYDTKITAYLDGGYDFNRTGPYAAIGARVKKALTDHTFAGVGLETQIFGKRPSSPILSLFAGFTF